MSLYSGKPNSLKRSQEIDQEIKEQVHEEEQAIEPEVEVVPVMRGTQNGMFEPNLRHSLSANEDLAKPNTNQGKKSEKD